MIIVSRRMRCRHPYHHHHRHSWCAPQLMPNIVVVSLDFGALVLVASHLSDIIGRFNEEKIHFVLI